MRSVLRVTVRTMCCIAIGPGRQLRLRYPRTLYGLDTTRTRTYATRRPRVELEAARLARKWRRVNVVSGTESGRRLHELMVVTAAPGGLADRRGEG